ncbi:MAG: nitrogen regulation protein NR(I) [Rhizobiales bacterium TMED83]|jgi:two-component system nitrogen regulation response regulator GlnG|nr:nitrogen regulation protein NR(I) [Rhodobiaceae bacterium]RPF93316.1 MAG: nitrogen regulation protein NR(I) [Rhizobiales bacterium TMED83]HCD16109.1 nitrogen regulation protein NR(I) [Rhodobiaceae bacterium]
MSRGTVLIADDDKAIRTVLVQALGRAGFDVRATGTASSLWKWVSNGEGDVIVTDVMMPDQNAFDLIPRIKRLRPDLPIVVISAKNTLTTAIMAAERGAFEYLPKPFDLGELTGVIGRAMELPRAQTESANNGGDEDQSLPLVGRSPAMQEIYRTVARLTQNDLSVLITGDSGTGKELIARALHDYGRRKHGQFVALNMAAIPRELIESELFGHEKGAFTGASQRMAGRFSQAEGGTLFLDEIGDMPMETQTRLLRVLQEGEFTTVGGRQPIKTDVRIIAATHQDLQQMIQQGLFREDLYFRLNVVPLRVPPLRERLEDIDDLVRHFVALGQREGLAPKSFDLDALSVMREHDWPGNVRELENMVRRIAALYSEDVVTPEIIRLELSETPSGPPTPSVPTAESLSDSLTFHLNNYFSSHGQALPPNGLYDRVLREVERPLIELTLEATRGNQVRAAELLGINRNTLRKKIRELGIDVSRAPLR